MIASAASIGLILACLFIIYNYMLLSFDQVVLLSAITVGAGAISFILHYVLVRPVEKSISRIAQASKQIADGEFHTLVPRTGPAEFQMLSDQMNEMSKRLGESFQKLRSSEASRRELVAGVSHDLRTPLASIRSYVEALEDEVVRDKDTFDRYLATIRSETERLNGLIEDLFQLSRLEAGVEPFEPLPCHADNLILEALQRLALSLQAKRLDVTTDIPDQLPPVSAMPDKIHRVLTNLLNNAVRHSPEGGHIRIDVKEQGSYIIIAVADQGEGVPEAEQARIFEHFYRVDKSRNRWSGGTGLGLAIAKSIVEMHQGSIGVISTPGTGSQFWFTIPRYPV